MNINFAQKSATWKVWPLVLYELKFCSKKFDMKCATLRFIWTEILLKKVRLEKCDPWFWKKRYGGHTIRERPFYYYYDSKNILWIQEFHEHLFLRTRTRITRIFCWPALRMYSGVLLKWEFFIKMRAACFAPSFLQKRGVLEWGWLQVGSSHFNEKFSL